MAVVALAAASCTSGSPAPATARPQRVAGGPTGTYIVPAGIHKIKHVIVIMQENRSFDSYFGTFPGADGIPMKNGTPTVCVPDPGQRHVRGSVRRPCGRERRWTPQLCERNESTSTAARWTASSRRPSSGSKGCSNPTDPACTNSATPDVMGYHTQSDIPNYWTYAKDFVLQDHMFEPNASWSLPAHLFLVSEWSAYCTDEDNPSSCVNGTAAQPPAKPHAAPAVYGGEAGPKRLKKHKRTRATSRSTPGRTSPTCSTRTTSAGATTW